MHKKGGMVMCAMPIYVYTNVSHSEKMWKEVFSTCEFTYFEVPKSPLKADIAQVEIHFQLFEMLRRKVKGYHFAHFQLVEKISIDLFLVTSFVLLKHENENYTEKTKTVVRIQCSNQKNNEKYMKTKEPFMQFVGYNILGEKQMMIDNVVGCAYNAGGFPLQAIQKLIGRIKQNAISPVRGDFVCQ